MANFRYQLQKSRDTHYLYLTYYIRSDNRLRLSVGEKINPSDWSAELQRVLPSHPDHSALNLLLSRILARANRVRVQYKAMSKAVTTADFIRELADLIKPTTVNTGTYNMSQDAYFARFHSVMGDYTNYRDAYFYVEGEWNALGVKMFPTYEAFKVGKCRYLNNAKSEKRAKAI